MQLENKWVAVFLGPEFEDLEFWVPVMRLREEGARVIIAGARANETLRGKGGLAATADCAFAELDPATQDGLVIPGGWAPDKLRRDSAALSLVQHMDQQGKVVAIICHGGLVGISAGIVRGRPATGRSEVPAQSTAILPARGGSGMTSRVRMRASSR